MRDLAHEQKTAGGDQSGKAKQRPYGGLRGQLGRDLRDCDLLGFDPRYFNPWYWGSCWREEGRWNRPRAQRGARRVRCARGANKKRTSSQEWESSLHRISQTSRPRTAAFANTANAGEQIRNEKYRDEK